jgi:transcriptional regulator with XRE-family HTH domain
MKRPKPEEYRGLHQRTKLLPADPNNWIEPPGGLRLPVGSYVEWDEELAQVLELVFAQVLTHTPGEAIKTAIEERGLTQGALAERLGLSQPRVGQLTQKERDLNLQTLDSVADAMGFDLELRLVDRNSAIPEQAFPNLCRVIEKSRSSWLKHHQDVEEP